MGSKRLAFEGMQVSPWLIKTRKEIYKIIMNHKFSQLNEII